MLTPMALRDPLVDLLGWHGLGEGQTLGCNKLNDVSSWLHGDPGSLTVPNVTMGRHIVPHIKFDRIGGTSSATFPNFKYVAPREICVERNCFDSPIAK